MLPVIHLVGRPVMSVVLPVIGVMRLRNTDRDRWQPKLAVKDTDQRLADAERQRHSKQQHRAGSRSA